MELIERIYWLIRLRWIAVVGVTLAVLFADKALGFTLPVFPLYSIAILLGVYNFIFLIRVNSVSHPSLRGLRGEAEAGRSNLPAKEIASADFVSLAMTTINKIANTQISLDLLGLAGLIHFSGGVENPFIFYFIFHMIIASILLSRRASYLQATFAVLLFLLVASTEYLGFLNHYCLKDFLGRSLHTNKTYISAISFVFISTLYIAVYMASSISVKLRQREKSLHEANILLEEKDRIKSEYVLRVSHDIKEHLSAIQTCVEPIADGLLGALNEKQKDLIERARDRTNKLLSFVRALLDITRIKLSKQIEINLFSLNRAVGNAIGLVEARAKDKGISIAIDIDAGADMIWGAEIYIEETIANLLANSVKYTPANGKVGISVKDKDSSVLIQISDTGIGIPKDEIPKLFNDFYRARNAKEVERTGTGLGLSIAKQVIERHRGKIWVESEEGKGSVFSIILPKGR